MPSSLLFAGLVVTWLAVLVPMAARRRRPMTRPSDAALSSRVLVRPVRARPRPSRAEEVSSTVSTPTDPGSRYRPGRGGYDPEAAALAARARCTFRQRVVLVLGLLAVTTALVAVGLKVPEAWWPHGGVDLLLVGYLVNLRRQVRTEQAIRARRAARLAGSRPDQGRERPEPLDQPWIAAPEGADPDAPTGEPDAPGRADEVGDVPGLPPLSPVPLPPRPAGTVALELDDEDPELHELDPGHRWGHRRAAGQ